MTVSRPPASATFISPRNSAMAPTRPMASSTALPAAAIAPEDSACIGATAPGAGAKPSWRQAAAAKAARTMPRKMRFTDGMR